MRVFVSYARAQERLAEELAVQLRQENHEVFFDRFELKAGGGFHEKIRASIAAADLFVFLISPDAVRAGGYALTELGLAEQRWPNAIGHLLPVMAVETPFADIPPYARSVNVLRPAGNPVAETLASVAQLADDTRARTGDAPPPVPWWRRPVVGAVLVAVLAGVGFAVFRPQPAAPCLADLRLRPSADAATPPVSSVDVVATGQPVRSFVVTGDGVARIDVGPLTRSAPGWSIEAIRADGSRLPRLALSGCPSAAQEHRIDASLVVVVEPRKE